MDGYGHIIDFLVAVRGINKKSEKDAAKKGGKIVPAACIYDLKQKYGRMLSSKFGGKEYYYRICKPHHGMREVVIDSFGTRIMDLNSEEQKKSIQLYLDDRTRKMQVVGMLHDQVYKELVAAKSKK